MNIECAWCGRILTSGDVHDSTVSHGICIDCKRKVLGQKAVEFSQFMETFPFPVLVIDSSALVSTASAGALAIFRKDQTEIQNARGGELLECTHAHSADGCGKADHCLLGCALRKCIMNTMEDGMPRYNVISYHEIQTDFNETEKVVLSVSTEKVGGKILVFIELYEKVAMCTPESFTLNVSGRRIE